jgi:hypothetical protein
MNSATTTTMISILASNVMGINSLVTFIEVWSRTQANMEPPDRMKTHVSSAVGASIHSHFSAQARSCLRLKLLRRFAACQNVISNAGFY